MDSLRFSFALGPESIQNPNLAYLLAAVPEPENRADASGTLAVLGSSFLGSRGAGSRAGGGGEVTTSALCSHFSARALNFWTLPDGSTDAFRTVLCWLRRLGRKSTVPSGLGGGGSLFRVM